MVSVYYSKIHTLTLNVACKTGFVVDDLASEDGEAPPVIPVQTRIIERPGFVPTPPQGAFQPGSTPKHLSSRFMVSVLRYSRVYKQMVYVVPVHCNDSVVENL